MKTGERDLGDLLVLEVYPSLFERLDAAFPEFGWKRKGGAWEATQWPASFPFSVGHENPDRLMVYPDRPWWVKVHGHGGVRFLDYVNGGTKPVGPDFPEAVRKLADLAGVPFPERELSEEEREKARKREGRRSVLAVVADHAHEVLLRNPKAKAARDYLKGRGFSEGDLEALRLGYYLSVEDTRRALKDSGADETEAKDAALLWEKLEGYVLIPWMDERGHPLTLYGRWVGDPPPGRPKTIALPGEGTKASPLYFDRARAAGHKELVLVEGVFDAALLQTRGDTRVVASVAAELSGLQVETLVRNRVRKVFICGDPDGGGDKGTLANIEALTKAGIPSFVVPRLPDGMDPDEYVREHGTADWKGRVAASVPGAVFKAETILGNVSSSSPDHEKRDAVEAVSAYASTLRGEAAAFDVEALVHLVSDRTGYLHATIADVLQKSAARKAEEERKRTLSARLKKALDAVSEDKDPQEVSLLLEAVHDSMRTKPVASPPVFSVDRLERESRVTPAGKPSGWAVLDLLEVFFNPGELAVIGARTGHCKTSSLVGLLVNWAKAAKGDEVLVFYSQEEPEVRVFHRLLSLLAVDAGSGWTTAEVRDFLRSPFSRGSFFGWPDTKALEKAKETLRAWEDRLLVVSRPAWTVEDLEAHARELADRRTVGAVLVDYLQRVPPPPGRYDRRDIEVSTVARRLKALAVDLKVPVVVGAQVNREAVPVNYGEKLAGKSYEEAKKIIRAARPDLSHLREGGAEQEADLVLGLLNYAGDYRTDADEEMERRVPDVTRLEVGALKNRYGVPGRWAALAFEGRFNLIRDPDSTEEV